MPMEMPDRIRPYSIADAAVLSRDRRIIMDRRIMAVSGLSNNVFQFSPSIANISLRLVNNLEKNLTLIPVVALALIDESGRVLLQQRRRSGAHGGLWEFPGGKIKPAETPEMALVREIDEELAIAIDPLSLVPLAFASDPAQPPAPRAPYVILLYTCRAWLGVPQCLAGESIAWFSAAALAEMARQAVMMPPLDVPLAQALLRVI